jgi:hypothetical protein
MTLRVSHLQKCLMLLALGGTTFAAVTGGGCGNAFLGDIAGGLGNGLIAGATDFAFQPLGTDAQKFVQPAITNALQTGWTNLINHEFPVLLVRQEIFQD